MFDFGNANESQKLAISTVDGPVLITAGPGTGKTFTLVQRAIYLIEEKNISKHQIEPKKLKEPRSNITIDLGSFQCFNTISAFAYLFPENNNLCDFYLS